MKTPSTLDKQSTAEDIEIKSTDPIYDSEKPSLDITETINAYKRKIEERAELFDKQEADIATRKKEFAIHKEELNKCVENDQKLLTLLKKCDCKTPVKEKDWADYTSKTSVRNDITKSIK